MSKKTCWTPPIRRICSSHIWKRPTYIKRDQQISKETYKDQKRPIHVNRDMLNSSHHTCRPLSYLEEAYRYKKRPTYIKRNQYISKETYVSKETYKYEKTLHMKRDLCISKKICSAPLISHIGPSHTWKRPIYIKRDLCIKRDLQIYKETCVWKETYIKRDLLSSSHHAYLRISNLERDLHISKETYIYQKRPIYIKRELYIKRDLYISQETCWAPLFTCFCPSHIWKRPTYIKRDQWFKRISRKITRDLCRTRDLQISKETCSAPHITHICYSHIWKRPIYIKRDLYTSKETCSYQKRPLNIKRNLPNSSHHASLPLSYLKEANTIKRDQKYPKRPAELLSSCVSAPLISEKRLVNVKKRSETELCRHSFDIHIRDASWLVPHATWPSYRSLLICAGFFWYIYIDFVWYVEVSFDLYECIQLRHTMQLQLALQRGHHTH